MSFRSLRWLTRRRWLGSRRRVDFRHHSNRVFFGIGILIFHRSACLFQHSAWRPLPIIKSNHNQRTFLPYKDAMVQRYTFVPTLVFETNGEMQKEVLNVVPCFSYKPIFELFLPLEGGNLNLMLPSTCVWARAFLGFDDISKSGMGPDRRLGHDIPLFVPCTLLVYNGFSWKRVSVILPSIFGVHAVHWWKLRGMAIIWYRSYAWIN